MTIVLRKKKRSTLSTLLSKFGTNAHAWLPGASGVSVSGLPTSNYLLSDGSTGYSTVDGVDGLTLDGMGALSSTQLTTNATFDTNLTGWTSTGVITSAVWSAGTAVVTASGGGSGGLYQDITTSATTVKITVMARRVSGSSLCYVWGCGQTGSFANAILMPASTTTSEFQEISFFLQKVSGATGVRVYINTAAGDAVFAVDSFSVKEYTGTHLTQATTANKPLVRRGAYNLLKYSEQFGNAAWAKTLSGSGVLPVVTDNYLGEVGVTRIQVDRGAGGVIGDQSILDQSVVSTVGAVYYGNCQVKATAVGDVGKIIVSRGAGGAGYRATTLTAEWKNFGGAETAIAAASSLSIGLRGTISSCSQTADFLIRSTQHTSGAAAEDYTPTTSTAASNPTAGKYWWSFDGSNDSLLSGNLGITNACTIVIAGRVNSVGIAQYFFGEDANGVHLYMNSLGRIFLDKGGVGTLVSSGNGVIVSGVPFVLTVRLSGGTGVIRLNGVQIASTATALSFAATTGARIGAEFAGTLYPLNGALGWVVPIAAALSDADCLLVERLVGSQFPGMATF